MQARVASYFNSSRGNSMRIFSLNANGEHEHSFNRLTDPSIDGMAQLLRRSSIAESAPRLVGEGRASGEVGNECDGVGARAYAASVSCTE